MSFERAFQDRLDALKAAGPARVPATIGEIWDTEYRAGKLDTMSGVKEPHEEAYNDLAQALEKETARPLADLASRAGRSIDGVMTIEDRAAVLGEIVASLPDDAQQRLAPFRDVEANARKKAQALEQEKREIGEATYGFSGMATGFLAGAARQMVEPVNIASMFLGGPVNAPLRSFLAREFAVNAGAQAAQEPFIQPGRAALGLEAGFGQAAGNIAIAGIGGAGLAGLFRGAGVVARRGYDAAFGRAAPDGASAPAARVDLEPEAFEAAARFQETRDLGDLRAPDQSAGGVHLHAENIDKAAVALESGRLAELPSAPVLAIGETLDTLGRLGEMRGLINPFEVPGLGVHRVATASGSSIEVRPVVVEAATLRASSDADFPAELQPRDRDRAASVAQVLEMAQKLDPERLGRSSEADRGAPIVGPDGVVESGNGRIMAVRRAYELGGEAAGRYRDWITSQGLDVSGFKAPVLVRERLTPLDPIARRDFAYDANIGTTQRLSSTETALADANRITPDMMALLRDSADLASVGNLGFVRAFIARFPTTEIGALTTAEGRLSAEGLRRVRAAVLGRAYGDAELIARITESADDTIRSVSNALQQIAPDWARMRAEIDAGIVDPRMDLTPQLMEAVRRTADLRARGMKLDTWESQLDAFETVAPDVLAFMRMLWNENARRAAGQDLIAERLGLYVDAARKMSAAPGLDLGLPEIKASDIQKRILDDSADARPGAADAGARAGDAGRLELEERPGNRDTGPDDRGGLAPDAGRDGTRAGQDLSPDLNVLPPRAADEVSPAPTTSLFDLADPGAPDLFARSARAEAVSEELAAIEAAIRSSGETQFMLPGPDGVARPVEAARLLDDLKDDAAALDALRSCMKGGA
ncbi:MAG: hypothetical protein J0L51_00080 [Rhizobiales bacterium]|nr:hypothetical protein [Hyphomicrobiales bacterium]